MTPETADTIRRAGDVVQWVNLAVALLILAVTVLIAYLSPRDERGRLAALAVLLGPATWAAHSAVFYGVILTHSLTGPITSLWSSLRVFHGQSMILVLLLVALTIMVSPAPPGYGDETDG